MLDDWKEAVFGAVTGEEDEEVGTDGTRKGKTEEKGVRAGDDPKCDREGDAAVCVSVFRIAI